MYFVAFLCIAATGLAFAASDLQGHGFLWADETCATFFWACDKPHLVMIGAFTIVAGIWLVKTTCESG